MSAPRRVAVVGGGIAGLAAAWHLTQLGPVVTTVFDDGPLGGKLRTTTFCGHDVDEGADAFIARVPHAVELCRALGLSTDLVAPAAGRALLWTGGRLQPFPEGLVLGVPTRLRPLAGSGLVSLRGTARAGLDLVLPASRWRGDVSVTALVSRRVGAEVARRLVDPLVGGIHAGRADELSAEAAAPQLAAATRASRSLMRGLRPAAAAGADVQERDGAPLFLAPSGGMGHLVTALVAALRRAGVDFAGRRVSAIGRAPEGGVMVTAGTSDRFDAAILAIPAEAAGALLREASPRAASRLASMSSASVAVVTFAYPPAALPGLRSWPGCSGFLVPASEGRLMTACSIGSAKWPHWSGGSHTVLRVSAGRAGDDRAIGMDDDALVALLHHELEASLGAASTPVATRVSRWPAGFPQYRVGHLDGVAAIEAALAVDAPGVSLAGASYRGVGIPACIASGTAAAEAAYRGGGIGPSAAP